MMDYASTSSLSRIISAAITAPRRGPGWRSIPACITSSFRQEPAGSICKRAGGVSSVGMRWLARVLPIPTRSNRPLGLPRPNSMPVPNLGCGVDLPRCLDASVAPFVIVFNERSSKLKVASLSDTSSQLSSDDRYLRYPFSSSESTPTIPITSASVSRSALCWPRGVRNDRSRRLGGATASQSRRR